MTRSIERQLIGGVWTTVDAEESAGGGGGPISGFAAHENTDFSISNSGRWKPSVLDYVSADWTADLVNGQFTVGADGVGLYLVECGLIFDIVSGGPADEVWADITITNTDWNVDPITFNCVEVPNSISSDVWRGHGSAVLPLGDGCSVRVNVLRHPYSAMTTNVVNQSFLRAFKIGVLS